MSKNKRILFLGGDRRERRVMQALLEAGHEVEAWGWEEAALPPGAGYAPDAGGAMSEADAVVLPVPPLREDGRLHTLLPQPLYLSDRSFRHARPGLPVLTGIVTPHLTCIAAQCRLRGLLDREELARPLAEATAEGAVAEAIRLSGGLLYGASALVIGYGRVGRALAWRLTALGLHTVVMNRGEDRAEQARRNGLTVADWSQLTAAVATADFIFNTVPAPVLPRERLQWAGPAALIVDLAAAPGGTDFAACAERGVRAVLAGGLPGRYAPDFCGQVMAEVYLRELTELWDEGEEEAEAAALGKGEARPAGTGER